jgi:hypothetical protein
MKLLIAFLLFPSISLADQYGGALDAVQQATLKQTGLENMLNNYSQEQLKHIPKSLQTIGGNLFIIGKIIHDRHAEIKWEFK